MTTFPTIYFGVRQLAAAFVMSTPNQDGSKLLYSKVYFPKSPLSGAEMKVMSWVMPGWPPATHIT